MEQNVEAIILAGGKGTRLAPLTEDTPKPMLKIMGKTVIESVFDSLCACGIRRASVTTMYLPWQIEAFGSRYGTLEISYSREKTPLGTAGAVRNACQSDYRTAIVLSGDGIFDFDLKKAINFHFEKNADATIITHKTENPPEYGVVLSESDGKIIRFEEKPAWPRVISGTVSTGIYILSRDIIERIPKNTEYDFSKQLFPLLLAEKKAIYAYEAEGVWHDIGSLDGYFSAVCSALDGKISHLKNDGFSQKELEEMQVEAEMPVYVSRKAVIGRNVKLGAYTTIGAGAVIADNCDIAGSVISDGAVLGMGCGIYGTIIGKNAKLGENCITGEGCAIGSEAEAEDSSILPKYSLIHSSEKISKNEFRPRSYGKSEKPLFGDDGIDLESFTSSPEFALRIGFSVSAAFGAKKGSAAIIGFMSADSRKAERTAKIMLEGAAAGGAKTVDFGCGFEAEARFASLEFITDAVIFVYAGENGRISAKIFGRSGNEISEKTEREISAVFFGAQNYTAPERFYEPDRAGGLWTMYFSALVKDCRKILGRKNLDGLICSFPGGEIKPYSPIYTAMCAVGELGGSITKNPEKSDACFEISPDGLSSKCVCREASIDEFHMNAAIIGNMKKENIKSVYLSGSSPSVYRRISQNCGIAAAEYGTASDFGEQPDFGDIRQTLFLTDGVYRTMYFASLMSLSGNTPYEIYKKLPDFQIYSTTFDGNEKRAETMRSLAELSSENFSSVPYDGVRLAMHGGLVTVIPRKVSGFRIIAEAASAEAAKELCAEAEKYLK